MQLSEAGRALRAVAWRMGHLEDALRRAGSCGAAFTLHVSDYRGQREVELHVKDVWIGEYGDDRAAKEYA
jgi:hypothetical protein